jgi:predicted MFS family arabinose efflux permease
MPVMLALSVRNAAPEKRGAANATYWTAYDLGVALGSMIWGLVSAALGYDMMYILAALPIAAALPIYFLWK